MQKRGYMLPTPQHVLPVSKDVFLLVYVSADYTRQLLLLIVLSRDVMLHMEELWRPLMDALHRKLCI